MPMVPVEVSAYQHHALGVARKLIEHGVPVFACPPGGTVAGYKLPVGWQGITPDMRRLDVWRPGFALAAVCGHVYDVIDIDPQNGGSMASLTATCTIPKVYAIATTPSGGLHLFIRSLGTPKAVLAPGIDLQAGADDGTGRGFVFIAPTVKTSKTTGEQGRYEWHGAEIA